MTRSHFFLAAALAVAVSCSKDKSPLITEPDGYVPPTEPSLVEVTGIVEVRGSSSADRTVHLLRSDGARILLVGTEAGRVASVAGAEVLVRGTPDASPGIVVDRFQVLSMRGRPALDGVLVRMATGLALQLADGSLHDLNGISAQFEEHVGTRMWVTGWAEPPVEFGVIEMT